MSTASGRLFLGCALGLLAATSLPAALREAGWCAIETPDTASPGQPIVVRVTLKPDVSANAGKLSNHLHWMKPDGGFGGTLSWQPPVNAEPGKTFTFRHVPQLTSGMGSIATLVYLSPDGDFNHLTQRADGLGIPVKIDPAIEAAEKAKADRVRRPASATLKRSSLHIVRNSRSVSAGDTFQMTVEYHLDPSEDWGDGTRIQLMPLGPWIDNPDGTFTTKRQHIGFPGLGTQTQGVSPGLGHAVFSFRLDGAFRYNEIQWMATFIGGDGKPWPWSVRGGGPEIERTVDAFDLAVPTEGGLFTYGENPAVDIVWGPMLASGASSELAFRLIDTAGRTVADFRQTATVGAPGTRTPVSLPTISERGVLLLLATLGGETREAFFARIPDVPARARSAGQAPGRPWTTPFGVTNVRDEDLARVARKLGATTCRHFVSWRNIEPLRDQWRFEELDTAIAANQAAGLQPWICLVDPPGWVLRDGQYSAGYEPFPFDAGAWRNTATALAERYRGRVWGFEWLNEIVPGTKSEDPAADYLAFCRIGTEAVRHVDPSLRIQLAGGLWPRNFRTDLLNGGIGEAIDVLPIHYGSETGVREALQDLTAVGRQAAVPVWDNETARGLSVWNMPPEESLVRSTVQSKWVLRQWPAELVAGAQGIVYFGGHVAAAGNWSYLLDRHTPRPVAATLAVLSDKLGFAKPVATAFVEPDAVIHLFSASGRGVAVASTLSEDDAATTTLRLSVGSASILLTDHQGNERNLPTEQGVLSVELGAMPVFLEGFDFATVAAQAALGIGTAAPVPLPTLTAVAGSDAACVELRVSNPLDQTVRGRTVVRLDSGVTFPEQPFELAPGAERRLRIPLAGSSIANGTSLRTGGHAQMDWTEPVRASVAKPFRLVLLDPAELGNLLKNGGMEHVDGTKPAQWSGEAESIELATLGEGPGFVGRAARFSGAKSTNYQHANQSLDLTAPGRSYLYSAWVWNHDMQAGSNLSVDGKTYYIPSVFDAGQGTKFWRLLTHVRATPPDAKVLGLTPVVRGQGWALYDNVRVTAYEGTAYAAEARRTRQPVAIDGDVGDWDLSEPIPLLCDNQLTASEGYAWTPGNLSGIASLAWDADALYFVAQVRDDQAVANTTGEETVRGDSVVIALHPGNRAGGADAQAFAWYVGAGAPGGGSGRHTLYRPPSRSGGLAAGQLARDSSVYELAIRREGFLTTYEMRIPWSETGGLTPAVGVKAGLSLQLIDSDGTAATGTMTWGGGLRPAWSPQAFGVLTLTE